MSAFKLQQLTTAFFSCHSFIRLFFFNFQTNKVFGSGESSTWPVISTATPYLALALTDALFASFLAWKAKFSQDCFQFSLDSLNIAQWDDVYSRGWKILHLLFQFTVILYFMLAGKFGIFLLQNVKKLRDLNIFVGHCTVHRYTETNCILKKPTGECKIQMYLQDPEHLLFSAVALSNQNKGYKIRIWIRTCRGSAVCWFWHKWTSFLVLPTDSGRKNVLFLKHIWRYYSHEAGG